MRNFRRVLRYILLLRDHRHRLRCALARKNLANVSQIIHRKEIYEYLSPLVLLLDPHTRAQLFGQLPLKK